MDQKNLCLLLSVLWVSKHNSKSLSSYLNTHSNKEPSVVSSFAWQGLQPRVFTAASNVPGEKGMIRKSHVLLRVGINYAEQVQKVKDNHFSTRFTLLLFAYVRDTDRTRASRIRDR